ncbi:DUF7344 domain-containing protein [Halohasta salina]|uniref:DUF7344 domain-containing protein n=1 Tax=Halohasta salina TaxID=2961621 RepID=UPI0020A5A5FC|nr:hypothetical protein [Halohasta salina]
MQRAEQRDGTSTAIDGQELSQDELLTILSNQRRRFAIHYLKQQDGAELTVTELAEQVAGWENDKQIEALTQKERKRVRSALRQFHLPKMADSGVIKYDTARGMVSLTEATRNANFYVDSLTGRAIPWGMYYLGFSALSAACLVGLWMELYPLTLLSPRVYGVFFVTALAASSIGHFYDNYYRMRLGARDKPLEVEQ